VIDDVANNASPDVAVSPVDVEATTDDIAPVVEVADAPAIN
jgi:hypothetical protein